MCGIAGIFTYQSKKILNAIVDMTDVLKHRGPDGEGFFRDERIALGHRRLSIIDLSEAGDQPLYNEDGNLVLVYNGEIYNYQELRATLIKKGHQFYGASDGEVILHLYEEEGENCIKYLDGMFAFALYNRKTQELLLARDRIGQKPLYYMASSDGFYFSSEIKSLLTIKKDNPGLSNEAIISYFLHTQVPAPLSIFQGILKVVPAHYMLVSSDGIKSIQPYWNIDYRKKVKFTLEKSVEKLNSYIHQAVDKTAVSDVPVGIAFSGGLDSSIILALLQKIKKRTVKTFTLGRTTKHSYDPEHIRAKEVSDLYNTDHNVYNFDKTGFSDFKKVISKFDEPFGIPDIIFTVPFNQYISKSIKVALTGNGADEIFAGYAPYVNLRRKSFFLQIFIFPLPYKKKIIDWLVFKSLNREKKNQIKAIFNDRFISDHEKNNVNDYLKYYLKLANYNNFFDAKVFLDLLVRLNHSASLADITGMSYSLELRSPFLCHHLIEFSARLPVSYKVGSFFTCKLNKKILKKFGESFLFKDMVYFEKFRCGQFVNVFHLMRTKWADDIESMLLKLDDNFPDFFCFEKINTLWIKFKGNTLEDKEEFFMMKVIIFLLWYQVHVFDE